MNRKPKAVTLNVLAGVLSLATVVTSSWVADGLNSQCLWAQLRPCDEAHPVLLRVLIAAVLFGVSVFFLYRIAKRMLPVRHLARSPAVRPHRILIAAISPLGASVVAAGEHCQVCEHQAEADKRKGKPFCVDLEGNLSRDIALITSAGWRWSGQQFLRALRPHIESGTLEHLVLIGSRDPRGSFSSLKDAEALVKIYARHLAPELKVVRYSDEVDFEDVEALQGCFDQLIEGFLAQGIHEEEIILDATGGQKTTSIAAALTTLRWGRIEFQYVQTAPQSCETEHRVLAFNVVVESVNREPAL